MKAEKVIFLFVRYGNDKHKRFIEFFSGRNTKDKEGTTTGDAAHDNVRTMNERRFMFNNIGDEAKGTCP